MVLTTTFNDRTGQEGASATMADHQAEVDAAARERRERDKADLAAESAGMENGRIKRFRPGTEAALRAEQARQGTDGHITATTAAMLTAEAWDRQLVTVGGVTMTNAERQAARKRILDNPDQSLQRLRERSLLKAGEEQDFLHALRRMTEIDDMRRNNGGRVSPELDDEYRRHQKRFGRAADEATADEHKALGFSMSNTAEQVGGTAMRSQGSEQMRNTNNLRILAVDNGDEQASVPPDNAPSLETRTTSLSSRDEAYARHASAPVLGEAFVMAKAATVPLDQPPEQAPAPVDPTMAGTGMDL